MSRNKSLSPSSSKRQIRKKKISKSELKSSSSDTYLTKGPWKSQEDDLLRRLVEEFGAKDWSTIATQMANVGCIRMGKQCRERWFNHLSPEVRKDAWTEKEDKIIIKAHSELGNKWTEISRLLTGRPANAIKNHWNSTLKRRLEKNGSYSQKPRLKRKREEYDELEIEKDELDKDSWKKDEEKTQKKEKKQKEKKNKEEKEEETREEEETGEEIGDVTAEDGDDSIGEESSYEEPTVETITEKPSPEEVSETVEESPQLFKQGENYNSKWKKLKSEQLEINDLSSCFLDSILASPFSDRAPLQSSSESSTARSLSFYAVEEEFSEEFSEFGNENFYLNTCDLHSPLDPLENDNHAPSWNFNETSWYDLSSNNDGDVCNGWWDSKL